MFPNKSVVVLTGLLPGLVLVVASDRRSTISKRHEERTAKPELKKHERNEQKTRKKHKLDNTTATTSSVHFDSASILSFPSEVIFILYCVYFRTNPSP